MRRQEGGGGRGARGRGSLPRTREARETDRGPLGALREELAGLGLRESLVPGSADPAPVSCGKRPRREAAVERREAPALRKTERGTTRIRTRLAALHPLGLRRGKKKAPQSGEDDGVPRAVKK